MNAILQSVAGNPENQDRGLILRDGQREVLCVADGAGGRAGGAEAASLAVEMIRREGWRINNPETCVDVLRQMDETTAKDAAAGETTCVVVVVTPKEIIGGSVGDSGAWWIPESGNPVNLTESQQRKPFVGTGAAWPVAFERKHQPGWLLLATDGLLKYTSMERISGVCRQQPVELAVKTLIDLVRYPSGALPDDVTIILAKL